MCTHKIYMCTYMHVRVCVCVCINLHSTPKLISLDFRRTNSVPEIQTDKMNDFFIWFLWF